MPNKLDHISAISLFVEEISAARTFYMEVFAATPVYEDEVSVAFSFGGVIVNLLSVDRAPEIIAPGRVAPSGSGSRMQLSVWVEDLDAVCELLAARGVHLLTAPQDRPWGMRTATFEDPSGHNWEIAQRLGAS